MGEILNELRYDYKLIISEFLNLYHTDFKIVIQKEPCKILGKKCIQKSADDVPWKCTGAPAEQRRRGWRCEVLPSGSSRPREAMIGKVRRTCQRCTPWSSTRWRGTSIGTRPGGWRAGAPRKLPRSCPTDFSARLWWANEEREGGKKSVSVHTSFEVQMGKVSSRN